MALLSASLVLSIGLSLVACTKSLEIPEQQLELGKPLPKQDTLSLREVKQIIGLGLEDHNLSNDATVAVIDSGVTLHPEIAQKIIAFKDFVNGKDEPYDDNGHGTAICGIIAGGGSDDNKGIAPNCNIVMVKAMGADGLTDVAALAKAIRWVGEVKDQYNIRILNISIGTTAIESDLNELESAVEELNSLGVLIISSSGNKQTDTVFYPAAYSSVLAVGCISETEFSPDLSYSIAKFSNRFEYHSLDKPDVYAPGNKLVVLQANTTGSVSFQPGHVIMSGTSGATAIVSGVASLIIGENPSSTAQQVRTRLLSSCLELKDSDDGANLRLVQYSTDWKSL